MFSGGIPGTEYCIYSFFLEPESRFYLHDPNGNLAKLLTLDILAPAIVETILRGDYPDSLG
ncbi:MAG: hypothetical protein H7829_08270 [Magnetococcus sp. THC-1_WYH]